MSDQLEIEFRELVGNKLSEPEMQLLLSVIATGQATVATGEKSFAINGSVNDTAIVTGDHNVVIQTLGLDMAAMETISALLSKAAGSHKSNDVVSVDDLVRQVRIRLHDDILCLYGTMPLWGIDHWVPLGDLFVNLNILEEVSSHQRLELADLWHSFNQKVNHRSLDRIGLGNTKQQVSEIEILSKNVNLMVVGKPSSGKSIYLQRVATECNAGNLQAYRIPTLIKLREGSDSIKSGVGCHIMPPPGLSR